MIGDRVLNAQQQPFKRTVLLRTDLAGIEGKEASVSVLEFAPEAVAGKHHHPGDEFVYVLEGTLILEAEGKPPVTLKPGDTFYQPPNQVHDARNPSTTDPYKSVVFFITEKGQPFTVPVK